MNPALLQTIPGCSSKERLTISAHWCSHTHIRHSFVLPAMGNDEYISHYMQRIALVKGYREIFFYLAQKTFIFDLNQLGTSSDHSNRNFKWNWLRVKKSLNCHEQMENAMINLTLASCWAQEYQLFFFFFFTKELSFLYIFDLVFMLTPSTQTPTGSHNFRLQTCIF